MHHRLSPTFGRQGKPEKIYELRVCILLLRVVTVARKHGIKGLWQPKTDMFAHQHRLDGANQGQLRLLVQKVIRIT